MIQIFDGKSIALLFLLTMASIIISVLEVLFLNKLNISMQQSLQKGLLESSIRGHNRIIDERGPGANMVNIFGDSEQISSLLNINYFSTVFLVIFNIIVLIITARWSYIFILVVIPTYIIMILILVICNKLHMNQFKKFREKVYEINPKVLEYIENRKTIVGYSNIQQYEKDIYDIFHIRDFHLKWANALNTLAKSSIDMLRTVAMIIFFILAMIEILNNRLELSSFITMITYFTQVFIPIVAIQNINNGMNKFKILEEKIHDYLESDVKDKLPQNNTLSFENCTFKYDNQNSNEKMVDLSLDIDKKIGLVGLSGEGKTTIIKILLGEKNPYKGKCVYGEQLITDISKSIVYSNIRVYSQEPEVFNNDLYFNITLGKKGLSRIEYQKRKELMKCNLIESFRDFIMKDIVNEKIEGILKEIFLLSDNQFKDKCILEKIKNSFDINSEYFLDSLGDLLTSRTYYIDEKYQEIIDDLEIQYLENRELGQRGKNISGGEKNKICRARFLLPEYSSYFVLDEPFTSLDILSEKKCISLIKKYMKNQKGIIISHKLDIIRELSESIIVLENGKITQSGTHDELVKEKGLYNILFEEAKFSKGD